MLFNSYTFIIFFLVVLLLSRCIGKWTIRKAFLLVVSYAFYAAWNPPFVLLLWISTIVDWVASKKIFQSERRSSRVFFLVLSLLVNLGMLSYFKYGSFFLENLNHALAGMGLAHRFGGLNIILPVGISFYTFQTLSYTLDIYRGNLRPCRSFLDYALYVTFFPQLVAGPIVRASEFLPQCEESKTGTGKQIGWGLCLFVIGLFGKVVLADTIAAPVVERVFASTAPAGFASAWTGTLAFAMQIFYDFFGYSTCAIGVALCLGFELPDNFRFPYAACGFSDFWLRWHISLSSWLRDYLYIPLGGNRKGVPRTYGNLMITMLLGGLWHGASWMFVIWGGLHAIYLMGERLCCASALSRWPHWGKWYGKWFLILLTFFLVCFTWVFFRARSLSSALTMCQAMLWPDSAYTFFSAVLGDHPSASLPSAEPVWLGFASYAYIGVLSLLTLISHYALRESCLEEFFTKIPMFARSFLIAAAMYLILISMSGEDSAFIYFQF
jgi:alginate O-acetyltransferase complex protein AlgI